MFWVGIFYYALTLSHMKLHFILNSLQFYSALFHFIPLKCRSHINLTSVLLCNVANSAILSAVQCTATQSRTVQCSKLKYRVDKCSADTCDLVECTKLPIQLVHSCFKLPSAQKKSLLELPALLGGKISSRPWYQL